MHAFWLLYMTLSYNLYFGTYDLLLYSLTLCIFLHYIGLRTTNTENRCRKT